MIYPVVHLNGTSREELVSLRCDAAHAVREALVALARMSPNGRDYYPVRGLFEQAVQQHERRATALDAVAVELETEALTLSNGEEVPGR